jgi:hypothetical protein
MEKVIYALWKPNGQSRDDFNAHLLGSLAPKLTDMAKAVRLNIQDEFVANGSSPKMVCTHPQMDAIVQLWVDTSFAPARAPIDKVIKAVSSRFEAWLVTEAVPIVNKDHIAADGERTPGFSQFVFLGRPQRLTWEAWQYNWQTLHTGPAIDTQSNFEYRQNLVVRPLTYGAPNYAGIVEECFPIEALNDEAVFYDAVGNPEKLAANQHAMQASCARFIDFDKIDCIPTSQYDFKTIG